MNKKKIELNELEELMIKSYRNGIKIGLEYIDSANASYLDKQIFLNQLPFVVMTCIGQSLLSLIIKASKSDSPSEGVGGDKFTPL